MYRDPRGSWIVPPAGSYPQSATSGEHGRKGGMPLFSLVAILFGLLFTLGTSLVAKKDPIKTAACARVAEIDACMECCDGLYGFSKTAGVASCSCFASSGPAKTTSP